MNRDEIFYTLLLFVENTRHIAAESTQRSWLQLTRKKGN